MDISVIVTAYNESQYIDEAIRSVLSQTTTPDEILLVDGDSTDGTQQILRRYAAEHQIVSCLLLENAPNIPEMRNQALRHVSGDLVTFLDGDDRFRPEKLSKELQTLEDTPNASIVFSDIAYTDSSGSVTGVWSENGEVPTGDVLRQNAARDWPGGLYRNALIPLSLLHKVGLYDEHLTVYEDWDLKIRTAARARVVYCSSVLTEYRRHDRGISARSSARIKCNCARRVYQKNRSILKTALSPAEFQAAIHGMQSHILELAILARKREGDYITAWRFHRQWLSLNPKRTLHIPSHAKHLLPPSWVQKLVPIYNRIKNIQPIPIQMQQL